MKKTNPWETKYVIMSSSVVSDIAVTDAPFQNISDENLSLTEAEILVPLRFFESNVLELSQKAGASVKELHKIKQVMENPYRLVVKKHVELSDGTRADWGIRLFDVLEHEYLEMGVDQASRELAVLDSYYRHNDTMADELRQSHEQNLVKLVMRLALAVTHYLNEESATLHTTQVKWLKSPFITNRERQMKQVYRNRQQEITHMISIDLSKKSLASDQASTSEMAQIASGSIEVRDSKTDELIAPRQVKSESKATEQNVEQAETVEVKVEVDMVPEEPKAETKKPRASKAKKDEIVLEVLEDGTKIVQYERAGYWRTQKNKETGEEKKIWIEPKIMTRRVAAK